MKRSSLNARETPYDFHENSMYNSNVNNRNLPKYKNYRFSLDMSPARKDFIPLNQSLPIMQHENHNVHRHHTNWRGNADINPRRWHNNRPNYHNNPQSNYKKQYSEHNYGNNGKKFYGNKMNNRIAHRPVNIRTYIDVMSALEDPWIDLEKKLNDSTNKNNKSKEETSKNDSSFTTSTDNCESTGECESKLSNSNFDNS